MSYGTFADRFSARKPVKNLLVSDMLTSEQLQRIQHYEYRKDGITFLEPIMQILWEFLFKTFVPLTVSPNTITTIGLTLNVGGAVIMMYFCPTSKENAPAWAYMVAAVTIFLYQIMDILDGKQCRRCGQDTHLEEFFDHGCDCVSLALQSVTISICLQLGYYPNLVFGMSISSFILFYMAHWQNYVSGTLIVRSVDDTEGLLIFCTICLTSALFGPEIWREQVPFVEIELKLFIILFGLAPFIWTCYCNAILIWRGAALEKTASKLSEKSPISPLYHPLIIIGTATLTKLCFPMLFEKSPCVLMLMFGMLGAKATQKILMADMSKTRMPALDVSLICPILLFVNRGLGTPLNDLSVLYVSLVWSICDIVKYVTLSVNDICDVLNVFCFDIVTKRPARSGTNNVFQKWRGVCQTKRKSKIGLMQ